MRRILSLFFILALFLSFPPRLVYGWGNVSEEVGETGRIGEGEAGEVRSLWGGLWAGFDRLFHPLVEIVSPVPLRLTKGIKPLPEPLFDGENEGEPKAASFFVQEKSKDCSVYSLDGDFAAPIGESDSGSRVSPELTEPQDRGEVWGARIAEGEKEVTSWFQDSGVMLVLLGVVGIALLVAVFLIGRRIWTRL